MNVLVFWMLGVQYAVIHPMYLAYLSTASSEEMAHAAENE